MSRNGLPVGRAGHLEAPQAQVFGVQFARVFEVIDDEDPGLHPDRFILVTRMCHALSVWLCSCERFYEL